MYSQHLANACDYIIYLCVCACVCVYVHVCVYCTRTGGDVRCPALPLSALLYSLQTGSLTELWARLATSKPQWSSSLYPSQNMVTVHRAMVSMWVLEMWTQALLFVQQMVLLEEPSQIHGWLFLANIGSAHHVCLMRFALWIRVRGVLGNGFGSR